MAEAEFRVNLDAKCKRCGKGGATQSGICMGCIAKGVKKGEFDHIINQYKPKIEGGTMADTRATVSTSKLEAKVKMVEEKVEGEVVDRHLMTSVTIEYEGTPARLETVLYALRAGHDVEVTFGSAQLSLDMPDQAEELAAVGG